jgi:ParB/RepB/Spo0J family partition protein
MSEVVSVPLSQIRENPAALRSVNRQSEDYLGLVDSIRQKGFVGSISGRQKTDPETGEEYIELIDGLHRYNASKDAGIENINIQIVDTDDAGALEIQIMANVHKVETRPVEYTRALRRMLTLNPLLTEAELADKIGKSRSWLKERLGLAKLPENVAKLVDEGDITLVNAYALAKLPEEDMADFVDRAVTMSPDEFVPLAHARAKEVKDAKRKGQDAPAAEFQPVPHLQKMGDLKSEMDTSEIGQSLLAKHGVNTALEAWQLAIQWSLHLDPDSVAVQRAKDEERKAQREEAKRKRAEAAKAKKAEKAAEKAKKAAEEAEAAKAALEG